VTSAIDFERSIWRTQALILRPAAWQSGNVDGSVGHDLWAQMPALEKKTDRRFS
jgi:hypothetical protein